MTVYNLGSINIDHFYRVPHIPAPGETLAAVSHTTGLGGKGANQSVAVARAGARVIHIGTVGPDGTPWVDRMAEYGVTPCVARVETATAHANICVDTAGENMIVIYAGANREQSLTHLKTAMADGASGDFLLLQNETNLTFEAAQLARQKGMQVIYSAAPFDVEAVRQMLPIIDTLVLNEVEAMQLASALGDVDVPAMLITRGGDGVTWRGGEEVSQPAFAVTPVDTTGAGDCFIGYVAAGLDQGLSLAQALRRASAASAIQVTRHGTADAIPTKDETDVFLAERETEYRSRDNAPSRR